MSRVYEKKDEKGNVIAKVEVRSGGNVVGDVSIEVRPPRKE